MEHEIKNKIIVVTGGAKGLGFQIAKSFLKEQAKLAVLLDIDEDTGNKAVEELTSEFGAGKSDFIKCDVVKDLDVAYQKICDKYHKIDVLINNAGMADENDPKTCTNVNLIATMTWSLKFLEHMEQNSKGNGSTIINVASIFGYRVTYYCPIYQATKFGVVGFTKSLGHKRNYDKRGVRVIAICPGCTRTSLTKYLLESDCEEHLEIARTYTWQAAEDVGENAVEIFKIADSGSIWEIEGGVLRKVE